MRLLVDAMCGGIVSYLRMCGHDTVYALDEGLESDDELVTAVRKDDRILITRDQALARRVHSAIYLTETSTDGQLGELIEAGVELSLAERPEYCGNCNGQLRVVGPDERTTTPAHTPDPTEEEVYSCEACGQYFWRGSHWEDVKDTLRQLSGTQATD